MASFEKRGKKWRAVVSQVGINGERTRATQTFATKKDAQIWATKIEDKKNDGFALANQNEPISDVFNDWYQTFKKPDIRDATRKLYENDIKTASIVFEGVTLKNATTELMQNRLDSWSADKSKNYSVLFWRRVKSALRDAQLDGRVNRDFWTRVKVRPGYEKKEYEVLSATQFVELQNYLYENIDDMIARYFLIALETGARSGEIFALKPSDIDVKKNVVHITKSYSRFVHQVTEPKNPQSVRDVPVTQKFISAMKPFLVGDEYLFSWLSAENKYLRKLRRMLAELDMPTSLRIHDLRHSHASYLLHNGISLDSVSKRLGHKNTQTTSAVYAHMLDERKVIEDKLTLEILSQVPKSPQIRKYKLVKR